MSCEAGGPYPTPSQTWESPFAAPGRPPPGHGLRDGLPLPGVVHVRGELHLRGAESRRVGEGEAEADGVGGCGGAGGGPGPPNQNKRPPQPRMNGNGCRQQPPPPRLPNRQARLRYGRDERTKEGTPGGGGGTGPGGQTEAPLVQVRGGGEALRPLVGRDRRLPLQRVGHGEGAEAERVVGPEGVGGSRVLRGRQALKVPGTARCQ